MPAPAVIPAPIAYIKFVAVKKLVVGLKNFFSPGPPSKGEHWRGNFYLFGCDFLFFNAQDFCSEYFTLKKLECSKQVFCLNNAAWDNRIRFLLILLVFEAEIMINRNNWGYSYVVGRGEILGSITDELMRKHLPNMFSLIKNESLGIEDDQIPS